MFGGILMMKQMMSGLAGFLLFTLLVTMAAAAGPAINAVPPQTVNEGNTFSVSLSASAGDNGTTSFNASITPQTTFGNTLVLVPDAANNSRATVTGIPGFNDAGVYTITVFAKDADSATSTSFTLTVNDVPLLGPQLLIGAINIGSKDQSKSNPDADDERDQDIFVTKTFTVQNPGTVAVTDIILTPSLSVGDASDYRFNFSGVPRSLAPGQSATVTLKLRVPEFIDAVDADLKKESVVIGQLVATGNGGAVTSSAVDMKLETENKLRIKDIKVCHDNDCENADDGDTIDDVKPGDHIKVTVEVKNDYSESDAEDIDIEDIEVRLETDDDEDLDLDSETEDLGDLSANDDDTVTVEFDVEDDASDGTAEFTIELRGEDEFGARHGEFARIRLDINRQRHEIAVDDIVLSPETLSCARLGQTNNLNVRVTARNIGKDDEKDVSVEAKLADLNIGQIIRDLTIDEDDEEAVTFNLNLPANVKPGAYEVVATSFINRDEISDADNAVFIVPDCNQNANVEQPITPNTEGTEPRIPRQTTDTIVVQTTPTTPVSPPLTPPTTVRRSSEQKSFGSGSAYVWALLAIILVLVLVGIGLIVAIAKKGSKPQ